jgi:dihydrofolate reductase
MGKIVISTNISLDGVVQDPDGKEGFRHGGWFFSYGGDDLKEWGAIMLDEALSARAVLVGRRSDEWFATRWLSRTDAWANRLNSLPKYVVSATQDEVQWGEGQVLRGDVAEAVAKLKQEVDGDIIVYASYQVDRVLMEHDLVDELRLTVFPVVLGAGERLFGEISDPRSLRLTGTRTVGEGLTYLTYERATTA